MKIRLLPVFLVAGISAGCATTNYQSPAPTRAEVAEAQAQIENLHPDRASLSLAEATDLATPVFEAIADDAARICRTVSEADSCLAPSFDIEDVEHVNAHAGFDREGRPMISLTRGLVEHLADRHDQLAMVIGHEYGHLITAHIEESDRRGKLTGNIMGTTLSILAATSIAVASGNSGYYGSSSGPMYNQQAINHYLQGDNDRNGVYKSFSKGQELEADYIGTYLATRSGYAPTGSALIEIGALEMRDSMSSIEKEDTGVPFEFWDTHPYSPERVARIQEALEEIEALKAKGYARPIPPRLIIDITDNPEAFHSLEELIAPLP